jgi:fructose-bisphosphate aldolase class I
VARVIDIGAGFPTQFAIDSNAHALARYAALCQEANIVPIVEPEVLMDGDHSIERCEEVTSNTLASVFQQLYSHRIHLEGMILKPNMVISGKKAASRANPQQVAEATCARSSAMCRRGAGHRVPLGRARAPRKPPST